MNRLKVSPYEFEDRKGDLSFVGCVSKTKASFASETDINKIMARALKTGMLSDINGINSRAAVFCDVYDIGDYRSVMDKITKANAAFEAMSAEVKNRFANDPARLVEFMKDPVNLEEACKLGLLPMSLWDKKVADEKAAKEAALKAVEGSK